VAPGTRPGSPVNIAGRGIRDLSRSGVSAERRKRMMLNQARRVDDLRLARFEAEQRIAQEVEPIGLPA
jgi:hypothetical protein